MPQVPSRSVVAHAQEQNNSASVLGADKPKIPSRPSDKRLGRSISPSQENYARSPLTKAPLNLNKDPDGNHHSANYSTRFTDTENCHQLSIRLPSIGQEGTEYADVYISQDENLNKLSLNNKDVNNSDQFLKPGPTNPNSEVKSLASTMDHKDFRKESVIATSNVNNGIDSQVSDSCKNTQGIPQIGLFVPMYPNAGDVQAPSQSLTISTVPDTSTDYNKAESKYFSQRLNGRGQEIPSDAYGRYGHGFISQDLFDKAYYKKHPELFKKEIGSYGEMRPEWALSSEDLNKIVQDTATNGTGIGSSTASFAAPSEQVGFKVSEEYICRISSPKSQPQPHTSHSNITEFQDMTPSVRKLSTTTLNLKVEASRSISQIPEQKNVTLENSQDSDVIHISDPLRSSNEINRAARLSSATDIVEYNTEFEKIDDDHQYKAPILAPDEVAKQPLDRELQPAVFPMNKNIENFREEPIYTPLTTYCNSLSKNLATAEGSPCSTPSIPQEDFNRYEPLFPEEEKASLNDHNPSRSLEILKRFEMSQRFPGQDVWEDTPSSLQYTTTVSAPQLPEEKKINECKELGTETPAQAFARRQEKMAEQGVRDNIFHQEKKNQFESNGQTESKSLFETTNHRFPSRDIWEDTPDSLLLQTTVANTQIEVETSNLDSEQKSTLSRENSKSRKSNGILTTNESLDNRKPENKLNLESTSTIHSTTLDSTISQESSLSSRQEALENIVKNSIKNHTSSVQIKAKPQVPARPARLISSNSSGSLSTCSNPSLEVTGKIKPQIPSRPVGGKIAALQGGFMMDLNKRLQLGPQPSRKEIPKDEYQNVEKDNAPLLDPRKSRARGPVRRAPNKAQLTNSVPTNLPKEKDMGISQTLTIWSYDPELEYLKV